MKRIIKSQSYSPVQAGISIVNDKLQFDWSKDVPSDAILLTNLHLTGFNRSGIRYMYAYKFQKNATHTDRTLVRNNLKSAPLSDENVDRLVEYAILELDRTVSLNSFGACVYVHSTKIPSLVSRMSSYIREYFPNPRFNLGLVKSTYADAEFDAEKAKQALLDAGYDEYEADQEIEFNINKFNDLKRNGRSLFEIKRFIPKPIRKGFSNFIKFASIQERKVYEALQGVDVLIYDDLFTSGTTIDEIVRCLKQIHDNNTLTVFILLKQ